MRVAGGVECAVRVGVALSDVVFMLIQHFMRQMSTIMSTYLLEGLAIFADYQVCVPIQTAQEHM